MTKIECGKGHVIEESDMVRHYLESKVDGGHECFSFRGKNTAWLLSSYDRNHVNVLQGGQVYVEKYDMGEEPEHWLENIPDVTKAKP